MAPKKPKIIKTLVNGRINYHMSTKTVDSERVPTDDKKRVSTLASKKREFIEKLKAHLPIYEQNLISIGFTTRESLLMVTRIKRRLDTGGNYTELESYFKRVEFIAKSISRLEFNVKLAMKIRELVKLGQITKALELINMSH